MRAKEDEVPETKPKKRRRKTNDEKRVEGLRAWVDACNRGHANPADADFDDVVFLLGQLSGAKPQ